VNELGNIHRRSSLVHWCSFFSQRCWTSTRLDNSLLKHITVYQSLWCTWKRIL